MVAKAEITLPSSSNPRFIFMPYFKVAPVAPVFLALYEPAKSTKKNLAVMKPLSFYDYFFDYFFYGPYF